MPEVTSVGSAEASEMATTTTAGSPAKAPGGPRRGKIDGADDKPSDQSPIGDAVLPLMLMAFAFGGVVYLRRRQTVE